MHRTKTTPAWLWAVGILFVSAIAFILMTSVRRPDPPVYDLSRLEPRETPVGLAVPDTVTLDARSDEHWTLFDFETRSITTDPATWDIAVKRHRLIVNGGEGFVGQGGVLTDPASEYELSRVTGGGDTVSAILDDWYAYDFFSHLLKPDAEKTFLVRTAEGNHARLRILSYYCPGPEPGCMTIEYVMEEE